MANPRFVHLRFHSEYSIIDGMVRIDPIIEKVLEHGGVALGIADIMNLFGGVRFYTHAMKAGLKPIIGCDIRLHNPAMPDEPDRLTVYCMHREGYRHLCELLTRAYLTKEDRLRGQIKLEWFEGKQGEGLIALTGGPEGALARHYAHELPSLAVMELRRYKEIFGDRLYVELQRAGRPGDEALVHELVNLAIEVDVPVVATHPVQFLMPEDYESHAIRCCISEGYTLNDPRRNQTFTEEMYLKTEEEMCRIFADIPSALENSVQIAMRCNLDGVLSKPQLPLFPTPDGMSLDDYIDFLAKQGLQKRLDFLYPDKYEQAEVRKEYDERLEYELGIIKKMEFPGYFLIVQDFINWSKRNDIPVGPGRGSGAGSLVAYALGITDLDPLEFDLLFERFLNPERVSMPDFDVDFCQYNRDRVIEYVKATYGVDAVSQIATFGTLGAKAVVRDVARALSIPYGKADNLAKLIPQQPGKSITLKEALETIPEFKEAVEKEEDYQELIRLAMPLEGMTRNLGMHAGGVLIAPGKLTDFCPLYNSDGKPENTVSQYDKKDVENVGLVKFDFLGLTTLSILKKAVEYIKKLHPDLPFELARIPIKDEETYQLFQDANTAAVFQFESEGMRTLLKQARPDRLEDLVALNALYRPGPMDLIPSFINRKFGREKVNYPDKRMEEVLEETYGIMVYQEQVMRVAQVIGGYTLGGADLLRRAMGKKNVEEMKRQRDVFIKGAGERGVTPETATEIFDLMEKFAGYGFNKSHAAAYSYVAYQTAYLKVHHTAAFMAANLCMVMDQNDKVCALIEDAKENGVAFLAPDVNESDWFFTVPDEGHIRYGLGAVKGVGEQVVEEIMRVRKEKGPFKDLFDFTARVKGMSARVLENLIKAGSFDSLDEDRGKLFGNIQHALNLGRAEQENDTQDSLFGDMEEEVERQVQWVDAPSWSDRERLVNEKKMLGFCFTGHLFDVYEREARHFTTTTLNQLKAGREKVRLCGVVTGLRAIQGKRGRMAAITITDKTAVMDVVVYSEIWDRIRGSFDVDDLICVTGRVRYDEFSKRLGVTADEVWNLMELRRRVAQYLEVEVTKDNLSALEDLKAVSDDLRIYQRVPVRFKITTDGKSEGALYATMKVSNEWVDALRIAEYRPRFVY